MLNPTARWRAFERQDERASRAKRTHAEALGWFEAMWVYARTVNPSAGVDWEADLAADRAVARAVNGLPPA